MVTFPPQTSAPLTLEEYRALEEERWRTQEKELKTRLGLKISSFFQMGFEGALR